MPDGTSADVEADPKCKSDWIYIKDTIEQFYRYERTQVKFSPVYMGGKGNYEKKQKEISKLISQYSAGSKRNQSRVIYCFDCDDYDSRPADLTAKSGMLILSGSARI